MLGRGRGARQGLLDGKFVTAVATTGIFCRPSCPARRPLRRTFVFLQPARGGGRRLPPLQALQAQCSRRFPEGAGTRRKVAQACRLIDAAEAAPKLEDLAVAVGLSPYHFHRLFRGDVGVTPKAYAVAHRTRHVRDALRGPPRDRSHLRGRVRFQRPLLRQLGPRARHDARANSAPAVARAGDPLRDRRLLARHRPRRGKRPKACARYMLGDDADELSVSYARARRFAKARLLLRRSDSSRRSLPRSSHSSRRRPRRPRATPRRARHGLPAPRVDGVQRHPGGVTATYAEIARRIGEPKAVRAVAAARALQTRSPSQSPAIASSTATAASPDTAGAWSASASSCAAKPKDKRYRSPVGQPN